MMGGPESTLPPDQQAAYAHEQAYGGPGEFVDAEVMPPEGAMAPQPARPAQPGPPAGAGGGDITGIEDENPDDW
jgi:hypothetical protein